MGPCGRLRRLNLGFCMDFRFVRTITAVLAAAALALVTFPVAAQPTCALPVSAYVTDGAGAPLAGTTELELRFYTADAPDALPVECRRLRGVEVDGGWIRAIVDACETPAAGDCGVAPLDGLLADVDALFVGIVVGGGDDELSPRLPVGAAPYALQAADSGTLDGLGPDAFEPSGAVAGHAADSSAHHSATSDGLDITPRSVAVGASRLDDGTLDLGAGTDDELTAEMVETLTGGGDADALHVHAGHDGGGGGCFTRWGANTCPEGWDTAYGGIGLAVEHNNTETIAAMYCVEPAAVAESVTIGGRHFRLLGPQSDGSEGDYRPIAGELLCAVCCR